MDEVKSTPWNVGHEVHRDEDIKIDVPGQEEEVNEVPTASNEDRTQRRFYIETKGVFEHGPTPGCTGCAGITESGRKWRHSDECIRRFSDILAQRGDVRIERWTQKLAEEWSE